MTFRTTTLLVMLIAIGIAWSGCKKDEEPEPDPATLKFEFAFKVGGEDVAYGQTYNLNGTVVSFDVINYYLGGLVLTQANGLSINLEDQYILAGVGNSATLNGELELSDIIGAKFFIGVDPRTNSQTETDFTNRPAGDPLGLQDPAMHWNWNTGYKFLRIDGDADTDADGLVNEGIAYHLGSDPFLKNYDLAKTIAISSGENTLTFTLDVTQFFNGVDLSKELDTHTGNNLPLAEQLLANMTNAVSLE